MDRTISPCYSGPLFPLGEFFLFLLRFFVLELITPLSYADSRKNRPDSLIFVSYTTFYAGRVSLQSSLFQRLAYHGRDRSRFGFSSSVVVEGYRDIFPPSSVSLITRGCSSDISPRSPLKFRRIIEQNIRDTSPGTNGRLIPLPLSGLCPNFFFSLVQKIYGRSEISVHTCSP